MARLSDALQGRLVTIVGFRIRSSIAASGVLRADSVRDLSEKLTPVVIEMSKAELRAAAVDVLSAGFGTATTRRRMSQWLIARADNL